MLRVDVFAVAVAATAVAVVAAAACCLQESFVFAADQGVSCCLQLNKLLPHLERVCLLTKRHDSQHASRFDLLEISVRSSKVSQRGPGLALTLEQVLVSFLAAALEECSVTHLL